MLGPQLLVCFLLKLPAHFLGRCLDLERVILRVHSLRGQKPSFHAHQSMGSSASMKTGHPMWSIWVLSAPQMIDCSWMQILSIHLFMCTQFY